ncbi:MAG: hypothetical protein OEM52_07105 [bacterium]|nr:hypothetical protein [bacterium]
MKRFLLLVLALCFAAPAFAAVGIGINYVGDYWKADELVNKQVQLDDGTTSTLVRNSLANPSGMGLFVVAGMGKYEFQADLEYVSKKYAVQLTRQTSGVGTVDDIDVQSSRIGLSGTLKYKMFSVPGVALFAGAGAGIQIQSPVVGPDLIKDMVKSASEELTVSASDLMKNSNKIGFHVLVQARVKPPAVPFGLQATLRGLILPSSTFEKPSFVPNLMVGVGFFPF